MTSTTTKKPRAARRRTTTPKKTMTESTYTPTKVVKTYKHTEPVIIDSHLKDVQVLSTAAYVQDFKNRVHINNVEVKELIEAHVEVYNYVQPYMVKAYDAIVNKVKELRNG